MSTFDSSPAGPGRRLSRREMLRELMMAGLSLGAATTILAGCNNANAPAANTTSDAGAGATGAQTQGAAGGATGAPIRLGFIPLTDCASLVVAKEMGFFEKHGVNVEVLKQANWNAVRDKVSSGELHGAHCLFGMPFSVASGVSQAQGAPMRIAMTINNNGQATSLSNRSFAGVRYADYPGLRAAVEGMNSPVFAMTFPGGTHDMWMHLTLAAAGIDHKQVQIKVIPPPQMVANMQAGNMNGFNVGEPWGGKAVADDIGFTFVATQDLWDNHPEKALVVNANFAGERRDDLKKVMRAMLEASQFIDDKVNNERVAAIIGTQAYVGAEPSVIAGRLAGQYELGGGNGTRDFTADQRYMLFHDNGRTNFPRYSHGLWFLTQYARFGKLPAIPENADAVAREIIMQDLYREVATEMNIAIPDDDMSPISIAADNGVAFDPNNLAGSLQRYASLLGDRRSRMV